MNLRDIVRLVALPLVVVALVAIVMVTGPNDHSRTKRSPPTTRPVTTCVTLQGKVSCLIPPETVTDTVPTT